MLFKNLNYNSVHFSLNKNNNKVDEIKIFLCKAPLFTTLKIIYNNKTRDLLAFKCNIYCKIKNNKNVGKISVKKYEDKSNVIGNLIKEYRENLGLSKVEVCKRLQLHAVYLDGTELKRMEDGKMIIKDFELIALCKVLNIEYEKLKNSIE